MSITGPQRDLLVGLVTRELQLYEREGWTKSVTYRELQTILRELVLP